MSEWTRINRMRKYHERKYLKPIEKALKNQIQPVLDALQIKKPEDVINSLDTLLKGDEIERIYKNLYVDVALVFARDEFEKKSFEYNLETKREGDVWEDIWMQEINNFFESQGANMVTEVTNTTIDVVKNQLSRIVQEQSEQGRGVEATARAIRRELQSEYFGKTAGYRSRRIAQTEVLKASNHSQTMVAEQLGYKYEKTWLTGGRSTVERHTTYPGLHGQKVAKGDYFDVNGNKMLHPGDSSQGAPASEIINCKCIQQINLLIP